MKFKVSCSLDYKILSPGTIVFNIQALNTPSQFVLEHSYQIDPEISTKELVIEEGESQVILLETGKIESLKVNYSALVERKYELIPKNQLNYVPITLLDKKIFHYLYPSRYCQSDRLIKLAYDKFGSIYHCYDQVVAITDWIYKNVEYVSGSTNSETSAFDTVTQRAGVCRDFAHLGIALSRALSIPARYFSGYAYKLNPPDFHACFEVYLGGKWILFDATRLAPLNGLVRIATGRDAADTSVATIYGNVSYNPMKVMNELLDEDFSPIYFQDLIDQGICLG